VEPGGTRSRTTLVHEYLSPSVRPPGVGSNITGSREPHGTLLALNGGGLLSSWIRNLNELQLFGGGTVASTRPVIVMYDANPGLNYVIAYDTNTWKEAVLAAVGETIPSPSTFGNGRDDR